MVPHSRPTLGEEEAEEAARTIQSGMIVDGPQTISFEQAVARQTGAAWGVAASSGTTALHLALLGLGVQPGDRVAMPSYVCVALLHAIRYVGAEAVIVDVDPETMNLDPDVLKRIAPARLKAAIVPHMFGLPAAIKPIIDQGIPVIEDCAHAIGASAYGRPVGGQGVLGICSFFATKMMTTGEGGMIVGQDKAFETRIRDLRDYDQPDGQTIRYNYKITEMQAAMGLVQLRRLPSFIAQRRQKAARFHEQLQMLDVDLPSDQPERPHTYYRYILGVSQPVDPLIKTIDDLGIACRRPVSEPIHRLLGQTSCPGADKAFDRALSIPLYPTLSDREQETVVHALQRVL